MKCIDAIDSATSGMSALRKFAQLKFTLLALVETPGIQRRADVTLMIAFIQQSPWRKGIVNPGGKWEPNSVLERFREL